MSDPTPEERVHRINLHMLAGGEMWANAVRSVIAQQIREAEAAAAKRERESCALLAFAEVIHSSEPPNMSEHPLNADDVAKRLREFLAEHKGPPEIHLRRRIRALADELSPPPKTKEEER